MAKIYGIGTGPGDKKYLTLEAIETLKNVDYIFATNNKGKNMALDTVKDFIDFDKVVFLDFPMKDTSEKDYKKNAEIINSILVENKSGAFITIGDPMFYSTVNLTFKNLRDDIEIFYVSGIPSFVCAAGKARLPLAYKGESILTTDIFPNDFSDNIDTYIILKTHQLTRENLELAKEKGYKITYIEKASLEGEKIINKIEDILKTESYLSLVILRRE